MSKEPDWARETHAQMTDEQAVDALQIALIVVGVAWTCAACVVGFIFGRLF